MPLEKWNIQSLSECLQQDDGYSCNVHVFENTNLILQDLTLRYSEEEIQGAYRERIAASCLTGIHSVTVSPQRLEGTRIEGRQAQDSEYDLPEEQWAVIKQEKSIEEQKPKEDVESP